MKIFGKRRDRTQNLEMSIEFKRCSSAANVPKRAYNGSAGYDI